MFLTKVKSTRNLVISPIMRPSDIWRGPSTSKAGIKDMVRAMEMTLATANNMSDIISGSSIFHWNRAGNIEL